MYGYGDFDGPVFRPSAGEFGRYGGRASLPFGATLRGVPGRGWRGVAPPPLRTPGGPRSGGVAGRGGSPPRPSCRRVLMADRRTVADSALVSLVELAD